MKIFVCREKQQVAYGTGSDLLPLLQNTEH